MTPDFNSNEKMEDFKKKNNADASDKDIVYSQSVKAGKRIYYIDVKKNRKDEMFLTITESKKIVTGEGDSQQVSFEKHKIFLYQEDFDKFKDGFAEALGYINSWNASHPDEYRRQIQRYNSMKKDDSTAFTQTRTDEGQTDDFSFDNSKYNVEMDF